MEGLKLITAPAAEPVDLATQVKPHLRFEASYTAEDAYLGVLIPAARDKVEQEGRRALITQTWDMTLDRFPGFTRKNPAAHIYLPFGNLQSVTQFEYTPESGTPVAVASSVYGVDAISEPGRVFLKPDQCWPTDTLYPAGAVRIRFTCGYGLAGTAVPWAIKQAILLTIGHFYENRESVVVTDIRGAAVLEIPEAAKHLIGLYQFWSFDNE